MVLADTSDLKKNKSPKSAVSSICIPRQNPNLLLPLQEVFQVQQVGLTQAPFKLLPLQRDPESVRAGVCPLRAESLFPTVLQVSHMQALRAFKAECPGGPWCRTPKLGNLMWDPDPSVLGRLSAAVIILFWFTYLWRYVSTPSHLQPSCLYCCGSFFISFVVDSLFCSSSGCSHRQLLCIQL